MPYHLTIHRPNAHRLQQIPSATDLPNSEAYHRIKSKPPQTSTKAPGPLHYYPKPPPPEPKCEHYNTAECGGTNILHCQNCDTSFCETHDNLIHSISPALSSHVRQPTTHQHVHTEKASPQASQTSTPNQAIPSSTATKPTTMPRPAASNSTTLNNLPQISEECTRTAKKKPALRATPTSTMYLHVTRMRTHTRNACGPIRAHN